MEAQVINSEDFAKLTKTEKVCNVFNHGKELFSRHEGNYSISLYTLNGFFVEIWYTDPARKIEKIEACDLDWVSRHYENDIELANLF